MILTPTNILDPRGSRVKEQQNRLFHRDVTLIAPEDGFELLPNTVVAERLRQAAESVLIQENETVLEEIHEVRLRRGRRGLSYPLMALMSNRNYGNVKAAMQQMVVSERKVTHGPIIYRVGEEEYRCDHVPAENTMKTTKSPTYDPAKEESIGEQLSVGKAVNAGDSFFWSTTVY